MHTYQKLLLSSLVVFLFSLFLPISASATSEAVCYTLSESKLYTTAPVPGADPLPEGSETADVGSFDNGGAYRAADGNLYVFTSADSCDSKGSKGSRGSHHKGSHRTKHNKYGDKHYTQNNKFGDKHHHGGSCGCIPVTSSTLHMITPGGAVSEIMPDIFEGTARGADFFATPAGDILYVLVKKDGVTSLQAFDPAAGWALVSGYPVDLNGAHSSLSSLAIDPATGIAYGMDDRDGSGDVPTLYTVNLSTGEVTYQATLSDSIDAEGLSFAADGQLYTEDDGNSSKSSGHSKHSYFKKTSYSRCGTKESKATLYAVDTASGVITAAAEVPMQDTETVMCNSGAVVESAPVAVDDSSINEIPYLGTLNLDIVANDSDADGNLDPSTVDIDPSTPGTIDSSYTVAGEGTWTVDASGIVNFTPEAGFSDSPSPIAYTVSDTTGLVSNEATITWLYLQHPPVANDDESVFQIAVGDVLNLDVTANDTDPENNIDPSTVDLDPTTPGIQNTLFIPSEGTWDVDVNGIVNFTPQNINSQPSPITYTVSDTTGLVSNVANILLIYGLPQ